MVYFSFLVAFTLAATALSAAIPDNALKPGFLKLAFDVQRGPDVPPSVSKRDQNPITQALINKNVFYLTYLYAGSNKQKIGVDIDTGSSDLWFVDKDAGCAVNSCRYGTYDPSSSTTANNLFSTFEIRYGDKTGAQGTYYTDDITLESADSPYVLRGLQFADATTNTADVGILGIGKISNEATDAEYPNFPQVMRDQNYISKNAYSLYLDTAEAATGVVLFGGKDLAKIDGDLVTLPVTRETELTVKLNTLSVGDVTADFYYDALLDSGTTTIYLPFSISTKLFSPYGKYNDNSQLFQTTCGQPLPDANLKFSFDGIDFEIPLSTFHYNNVVDEEGNYWGCGYSVGELSPKDPEIILGDFFMRSAYIVYDLDADTISLGHPKYTTDTNVVPI